MDTWQTLLIHLFKEGQQWASKLGRDDWRRPIAKAVGNQTEPPLYIVQNESEAIFLIRSETTLNSVPHKGFVIAPDQNNPDALMLLAPITQSIEHQQLSFQLGIMLNTQGNKSFFGYRFESPHEYAGQVGYVGHDYYHAQPIQSFGSGNKSGHSIPWYPDTYPAFPLSATNGVELVASMLLSCRKQTSLRGLATSSALGRSVKDPLCEFLDRI